MGKFTLSVIIPCYNEKDHVRELVLRVLDAPIPDKEIIIVDDCSTDGSRELLEQSISPMVSKIIYHKKNRGKGGAIKTGLREATGDIVIIQDADLEYDPREYPKLVRPILEKKCKVCYGSRFLQKKGIAKGESIANHIANRFLTCFSNFFTHQNLTDMETCYKAFRRDVIQKIDIQEMRFGLEPELTAKISDLGIRIHEVPISYNPRSMQQGKKIGIKDGLRAVWCIVKYH